MDLRQKQPARGGGAIIDTIRLHQTHMQNGLRVGGLMFAAADNTVYSCCLPSLRMLNAYDFHMAKSHQVA